MGRRSLLRQSAPPATLDGMERGPSWPQIGPRVAAILAWVPGIGFGMPCGYAIWYLADQGWVWIFMGFPTYGAGPFEDAGIATTVPLQISFWSSAWPSSSSGGCSGVAGGSALRSRSRCYRSS